MLPLPAADRVARNVLADLVVLTNHHGGLLAKNCTVLISLGKTDLRRNPIKEGVN
jgi:hypothetical protein